MTSQDALVYYKSRTEMRNIYVRCAKYVSQFEDGKSEKSRDALNHLFRVCSARRGNIARAISNFTEEHGRHGWPPGLYMFFPIGFAYEKGALPAGSPEELELKLRTFGF